MAGQVKAAIGHAQTLTIQPQASVQVVKAKPKLLFKHKIRNNNPAEPAAASGPMLF